MSCTCTSPPLGSWWFLTGWDPAERQLSWSLASCCPQNPPSELLRPDGWCTPWRCQLPRQQRWSRGSRRWSWCPGGWSTWHPGQLDLTSNCSVETYRGRNRRGGVNVGKMMEIRRHSDRLLGKSCLHYLPVLDGLVLNVGVPAEIADAQLAQFKKKKF